MLKTILATTAAAIVVVSAILLAHDRGVRAELNTLSRNQVELRDFSEKEAAQVFLLEEVLKEGLAYRDYRILKEVIRCESGWRQYWKDGRLIVSSGNIGLGQINRSAHERTYTAMGMDVRGTKDNLRFTVFLYRRDGLRPWREWSGHCWAPRIAP